MNQTKFKTKFVIVVTCLMSTVFILAGVFYISAGIFSYHLERSRLAQNVLSSYLAVSTHSYRKLNATSKIFDIDRVDDIQARRLNEQSLRDAIDKIRAGVVSEITHVYDENEAVELDLVAELERTTDRIIEGSASIRQFIKEGRRDEALNELVILRSDAVSGHFNDLINKALEEQYREVLETETEARELGEKIRALLPLSIVLILVPSLLITIVLSRRLSRSVEEINNATKAFTLGDLEYRTDLLFEREFSDLGHALNKMAEELLMRRQAAAHSHEKLESQVSARTLELESLNTRLENLDRRRRQLLADISHELRTPLTVIQGESEMALRGGPKTEEVYRDALMRVREQTMHTARLIDDLLFVARAEEGKARIEKKDVIVADVLRSVCRDLQSVATSKQIEIKESYADQNIVVFGDSGRLRQVFTVLLENAIRYSHTAGVVMIELSLSINKNTAEITFTDTGIGLTEEESEQAFMRFYRGNNAERYATGTGLGLPVAKAIVEAHNGEISITGKIGEGAQATVRLPVDSQTRAIT